MQCNYIKNTKKIKIHGIQNKKGYYFSNVITTIRFLKSGWKTTEKPSFY